MDSVLLATTENYMLYALPLIISVSLVYAATRHERPRAILVHAVRVGIWIVAFMAVILAGLTVISWCL